MSLDFSRPRPLIEGPHTLKEIDDVIAAPMERPHHREFFYSISYKFNRVRYLRNLGS